MTRRDKRQASRHDRASAPGPVTLAPVTLGWIALGLITPVLTGCGEVGPLQQPPPLVGQAARNDYYAQKAARARAAAQQNAATANPTGSAEREANTIDNDQPLSTRDIQDPNSKLTTPRDAPVPGESNPLGPNVSTTPPN